MCQFKIDRISQIFLFNHFTQMRIKLILVPISKKSKARCNLSILLFFAIMIAIQPSYKQANCCIAPWHTVDILSIHVPIIPQKTILLEFQIGKGISLSNLLTSCWFRTKPFGPFDTKVWDKLWNAKIHERLKLLIWKITIILHPNCLGSHVAS